MGHYFICIMGNEPMTVITYVKWDFNRSICDKFSRLLDADHQGEFAHRFILGLYRVLETLTTSMETLWVAILW